LVRSAATFPTQTEIVIVGGGIIGSATALYLSEKGIPNVLCEKGEIAGEQSSRNWGWCRTLGREMREVPLSLFSLSLWRDMKRKVGAETGFRQAGTLYLSANQAELENDVAWLARAREYQVNANVLSPADVKMLLPGSSREWTGGLYAPEDGRAEPAMATQAIAAAAAARRTTVLTQCAVRSVETTAGRVSGVVTEHGLIRCDGVVVAGGAWSRMFLGNAGIALPQLRVLASVLRTTSLENGPEIATKTLNFSFRKRLDGGYTVATAGATISQITPDTFRQFASFFPALRNHWSALRLRLDSSFLEEMRTPRRWQADEVTPFERMRVLDPAPSQTILNRTMRDLRAAFPAFNAVSVAATWGGMIDVTPDSGPIIDELPTMPGLYVATGFSGHGFGLGPGAGRTVADLVAGDTPIIDTRPFSYRRFFS
jgi:glycine/D-amino acid oxidase-like deaminating enzyme